MTWHIWAMGLRRAAVALPAAKGFLFGGVGGLALVLSLGLKGPQFSFAPLALFFYSVPLLAAAIVYLTAAFLLARSGAVWQVPGALLDAAATLTISWALVAFFSASRDTYGDGSSAVSIAVAAAWAGTLLPAFLLLLRQIRLASGFTGSTVR